MANDKILIHYYHDPHTLKVIISVVVGGGGGWDIETLYHHFTQTDYCHFFFISSFHHHLHALIRKTYFVWVRLLDSMTMHFTELNSYGRSCYTIRTHHNNPARIVSRSLPNLLAGWLVGLFSESPGI
jgi:hypothetical protein